MEPMETDKNVINNKLTDSTITNITDKKKNLHQMNVVFHKTYLLGGYPAKLLGIE